jgi:hypothetical protein
MNVNAYEDLYMRFYSTQAINIEREAHCHICSWFSMWKLGISGYGSVKLLKKLFWPTSLKDTVRDQN